MCFFFFFSSRRRHTRLTCDWSSDVCSSDLSVFSFLEGASQPERLIERAVELEMPAMALLDRNGLYGSARFHTSAKRNNVRAHVGAEIAVSSLGPRLTPPAWLPHQHVAEPARLALLCESREGYQNLCQLVTRFKMRETAK